MLYTFDVGGTSTKMMVFDKNDKIVLEKELKYDVRVNHFNVTLLTVLKTIKNELPIDEEFDLGIDFPGTVDDKIYRIGSESAIVEIDVDIKKEFSHFKNLRTFKIENDAKAAALGEFIFGQNKKPDNMVHLTLGTGVGGGIIIDKKIYKGNNNYAGEFSKLFINMLDENLDALAMYAGTGASLYRYYLATDKKQFLSGIELFEKYKNNDQIAQKIIDVWVLSFSKFIMNLDRILCLDIITIGGGISANDEFMNLIIAKVNQLYEQTKVRDGLISPNLKVATLKNNAGCYGMLAHLKGIN